MFEEPGTTNTRFSERVHSKVQLFVVTREGDNYCSTLPIVSYSRRGVAKPGLNKSKHSIIYSSRNSPLEAGNEALGRHKAGIRPNAICGNLDDRADPLHMMSRLDYGKVYTIQHNIKIKSYSVVHHSSPAALRHQSFNV